MRARRRPLVVFFVWTIALLVAAQASLAQSPSPKRTSDVFVELLNGCILNAIRGRAESVVFQPETAPGFKRHLDAGLQAALLASGFVVYESTMKKADAVGLSYQLGSSSLSYRTLSRQGGDEITERRFELGLFIKLVDDDEKVVVAESAVLTALDTVRTLELTALEDARFPETKKSELKPSLWESVAAPAAVVGALGVIVFLFFSVRSR